MLSFPLVHPYDDFHPRKSRCDMDTKTRRIIKQLYLLSPWETECLQTLVIPSGS